MNFQVFVKIVDPEIVNGKWDREREYPVLEHRDEKDRAEEDVLLPDEDGRLRYVFVERVRVLRVVYPPSVHERIDRLEVAVSQVQALLARIVKVEKKPEKKKSTIITPTLVPPADAGRKEH